MLDEKDRRALGDIERRLHEADPVFARRMSEPAGRTFPTVAVLGVAALLALPFVAKFCGPRAALITADIAAVTVTVVLIGRPAWRRRSANR